MTEQYAPIVVLSEDIITKHVGLSFKRRGRVVVLVDSKVQGQVVGGQTQMQKFNFFFGIQLGVSVFMYILLL